MLRAKFKLAPNVTSDSIEKECAMVKNITPQHHYSFNFYEANKNQYHVRDTDIGFADLLIRNSLNPQSVYPAN